MTTHKNHLEPSTDHELIRCWIQHHHGAPAILSNPPTHPEAAAAVLRIDFTGLGPGSGLAHISWNQWFALLDAQALAFRFPDTEDSFAFQLVDTPHRRPWLGFAADKVASAGRQSRTR
ncbi:MULTISPECIES: hypothetical protein [Rhodococcus]|uniref:hypothetical protein n=1 Tax=Rhodococcus TaxID=1827 RepID=UPI0019179761|nr:MULTISPECIES: hypothetical protein [Rhodococcus]QQZ18224.1 hypothetical protein GO592_38915 [Rhodococcus sp. 21391]UOT08153.1 hypothetical protein MPY17_38010 [Rhodococcus opacus]